MVSSRGLRQGSPCCCTVLHALWLSVANLEGRIGGRRPTQFRQMAPVIGELRSRDADVDHSLVHTGRHYERLLSDVFLQDLAVPPPSYSLEVGSGTHAVQTARVIERLEIVLQHEHPDLVIVSRRT